MREVDRPSRPVKSAASQSLDDLSGARVLIIGNTPPPHGGIAVHVQSLHDRLRELDAWVRVLSLGNHRQTPSIQGVADAPALAAELASHALIGFLPHLHVSGHTPKSWMIAAAVAALRRPVRQGALLTLHSGMVPMFLRAQWRRRFWFRAVARGFSAIFAVNEEVAEAVHAIGVPSDKIRVLAAGFIPAAPGVPPPEIEHLRRRSLPLIASAIAQGPIYAAQTLVRALPHIAARLPCAGLALFGPGPVAPLRSLAQSLGVLDRVAFLGELNRSEALAVMAQSDLFLRATRADGDAICVREALCLGKPVVASRVGVRPEGVHLFTPGDSGELCRQIESAFATSRAPGRLQRALDAQARAEADLDQVLHSYLAILDGRPLPSRTQPRRPTATPAALPERATARRHEARQVFQRDARDAPELPFGPRPHGNRPFNVPPPACPLREGLNALVNAPKFDGEGLRKE